MKKKKTENNMKNLLQQIQNQTQELKDLLDEPTLETEETLEAMVKVNSL